MTHTARLASEVLYNTYTANEKILKKHLSDSHYRKIRKLANNPKLFIQDVVDKRTEQVRKYLPIKHSGHFQYTVVSAVYNVEKYLDEYFDSLVNQSLNFKKHIHLILVDDGSTDNSANIIKRWQKKYPKNIHYYYKENGGQASARNLGLQYVKTEWVTFIDPDDFVSKNYFLNVDTFLAKNNDRLSLVSCSFIFYFDNEKIFKNTHPLKYRFTQQDRIVSLDNMSKDIQLSVNSAFFNTSHLLSSNIRFHEEVKPNFEDAKFVGDYFASLNQDSKIAFIDNASYFYRKRSDGTSTLDGAWKNPSLYSDVLSKGCLMMLKNAKDNLEYVPIYMQRTVLYHLAWYFKYLVNHDERVIFLTFEQKQEFLVLLHHIFDFIDEQIIMEFELAGTWFFQKVSWVGYFKKKEPPFQIAYIENIDREKKQFLIYYFSYFEKNADFTIDGQDIIPAFQKTVSYDFVGTHYVYEHRYWVSYEGSDNAIIRVKIHDNEARITLARKQHKNGLPIKVLLRDFEPKNYHSNPDIWIIMDRDTQADDNGEHLYRHIAKNHPEREIYFAINKSSKDWQRLTHDGFNLLDFGSQEFENKLKQAGKLISSHLDKYINDYFGDNFEFSKKFVFLQHGVTMNDLSSWVNSKCNLHGFVMATLPEYHAITGQCSRYKTTKKEAMLCGFPRHDKLLLNNNLQAKTILIMPTWRANIIGQAKQTGNERLYNPNFMQTNYAQCWHGVLHSQKLKTLSKQYGYQIIFAPHANIAPYLSEFNVPNYIKTWQAEQSSIQELFQNSSLMITDYSSVHFEMAILNKTVLYYQFDKDDFFNGGHVFQQSYFDYEKHGFGAVVQTENELFIELEKVLQNDGNPVEPYTTRIRETFPFRDGKCCERVYQAILDLDKPDDGTTDTEILADMLDSAYRHSAWQLMLSRAKLMMTHGNDTQKTQATQYLTIALLKNGDYHQAKQSLVSTPPDINQPDGLLCEYELFSHLGHRQKISRLAKKLQHHQLTQAQSVMTQVWTHLVKRHWQKIIDELTTVLQDGHIFNMTALRYYEPELLLAQAYRELGSYQECHQVLLDFTKHTNNSLRHLIQTAHLNFIQGDFKECVNQYQALIDWGIMNNDMTYQYPYALMQINRHSDALSYLQTHMTTSNDDELKTLYVQLLAHGEHWQAVADFLSDQPPKTQTPYFEQTLYHHVLAKYRLGRISDAYQLIKHHKLRQDDDSLPLMGEIALLMNDIPLAIQYYSNMIAMYPHRNKDKNMDILVKILSQN